MMTSDEKDFPAGWPRVNPLQDGINFEREKCMSCGAAAGLPHELTCGFVRIDWTIRSEWMIHPGRSFITEVVSSFKFSTSKEDIQEKLNSMPYYVINLAGSALEGYSGSVKIMSNDFDNDVATKNYIKYLAASRWKNDRSPKIVHLSVEKHDDIAFVKSGNINFLGKKG